MEKLVTVIVPVYNVESYLAKCLDSVVGQTYRNLQIILVNDGTKDNSLEICEKYARDDSRIIIINKQNGGLSSARNKGMEYAEGEYCYFMDSDDYIESDLIEKAVAKMESEAADMVVFGIERFREEDGGVAETFEPEERVYELADPRQRFEFIAREYYQCHVAFEVWNKLYRMDIIKKYGIQFEDNRVIFSEDVCFLSYYLLHACRIVSMSDKLYHYVIRGSSLTGIGYKEPKVKQFHLLLNYVYKYAGQYDDGEHYIRSNFEYMYVSLMHDQYKRVGIGELPALISDVEEDELFKEMSVRAYRSRGHYIRFFGLKMGDLLSDESYVIYHRHNKAKISFAVRLIQLKRNIRTMLKNLKQR